MVKAIYRRHSVEEMSVPVCCWKVSHGQLLSDNEFIYFLAPQQIAHFWTNGLQSVRTPGTCSLPINNSGCEKSATSAEVPGSSHVVDQKRVPVIV